MENEPTERNGHDAYFLTVHQCPNVECRPFRRGSDDITFEIISGIPMGTCEHCGHRRAASLFTRPANHAPCSRTVGRTPGTYRQATAMPGI